jgi:hypothetical protein
LDYFIGLLFGALSPSYFYVVFRTMDYSRVGRYYVGYGFDTAVGGLSSGDPNAQMGFDGLVFAIYGHALYGLAFG